MPRTKRQHLNDRSQFLNPDLQAVLLATWPPKWPTLRSDEGWSDAGLDELEQLLDVFELAQWALDTPTTVIEGRGPGKLCAASSDMRTRVKSVLLGLSVARRKNVEAACVRLRIPSVLSPDFTDAHGRYVLSHLVTASASISISI
jgi:hypothetical protein